jgi:hypothetical protein
MPFGGTMIPIFDRDVAEKAARASLSGRRAAVPSGWKRRLEKGTDDKIVGATNRTMLQIVCCVGAWSGS